MSKKYWLMKSEPETFSIDDLERNQTTWWDGVRNYQARNFMMNDMRVGDEVLFYHSNADPSGVVGLATVAAPAAPDKTALDKKSPYYDPKATVDSPRWFCVQVRFKSRFKRLVSLEDIKKEKALKNMILIKKGTRLSIQPVSREEYDRILAMGSKAGVP